MTPSKEQLQDTREMLLKEIEVMKDDLFHWNKSVVQLTEDIHAKQKRVDAQNLLAVKFEKLASSLEDEELIQILNKLKDENFNKAAAAQQYFFRGMNDTISDLKCKIEAHQIQISRKEYLIKLIDREIRVMDRISNIKVSEVLDMDNARINPKALAKYRKELIMSQLKKAINAQVESFKK